jgi:hypothetical protein
MSFYDVDLYEWPAEQARLLREGRVGEADLETIAEGLEDMSRGTQTELRSRMRQLLMHLLKYEFQPGRRTQSWVNSIANQRAELEVLLQKNPSLRPTLSSAIAEVFPIAVRTAAVETGLPKSSFPSTAPWTPTLILDSEFLPGPKEQ